MPPALGGAARQGVLLLALRQAAIQVVNFGAAVALARLLAPADFGVYSIVVAIVVAVTAFGDFGFSAALLQRAVQPVRRDVDRNFTMTLGATMALLAAFSAGCTAVHVLAPGVLDGSRCAMAVVAASASLWWAARSSLVVQHEAALRYGPVAATEFVEAVAFQGAAVVLALAGCGPWSFVLAMHLRALAGLVTLLLVTPLRPHLTRRLAGARADLMFGIKFQAGWMAHSGSTLALPLAVTPTAGATGLGLYTNANNNATRVNVLVELMSRVALPTLARAHADPGRAGPPERRFLLATAALLAGWAVFITTQSEPFTVVVFGSRWLPAAVLLQILGVGSLFSAVTVACGVALSSRGRPGQQGWVYSLRLALMFPALLLGGWLGGLRGIAWGSVGVDVASAVLGLGLLGSAVWRPFLADVASLTPALGGGAAVDALLPGANTWASLLTHAGATLAVFAVVALAANRLLRHEARGVLRVAGGVVAARGR